ncbi:MAG: LAGLIDADG family homing endonuclease [archaeon]
MLTDGYLKQKFYFNTTSEKLAENMMDILDKFNLKGKIYTHKRKKYGWRDLHMVYLTKKDSKTALNLLNKILEELNYEKGFLFLKGYK